MTEIYRDERFCLGETDGAPVLIADDRTYRLSCHPYEPCTYIKEGETLLTAIHNAFDPASVLRAFRRGERVTAITGTVYSPRAFCEMLAFAAARFSDTDISYVEGAMAVERLKTLGAISEETAVRLETLGVRAISDRFSHSKKLNERVMYTDDERVYLRIKK